MEKRGKLEKDAQIMIKMLPPQVELEKKNRKASGANDLKQHVDTKLNKSVGFDYTEHEGRFTKTLNNIAAGEEVLVESAVCAVLMERFSKSHCQHCFARYPFVIKLIARFLWILLETNFCLISNRSITPLPCPNCVDVIFCSQKCRNASTNTYHKYECGILETIWLAGSSINCQMAMRLVAQRPLSYFKSIRNELADTMSVSDLKRYVSSASKNF